MVVQVPFLPFMGGTAVLALGFAKASSSVSTAAAELWALSIALVVYVLYYSWIYPFYISPLRHIPTVPGFPLWGQFYTIITTECGVAARQWHQDHGPIIRYL